MRLLDLFSRRRGGPSRTNYLLARVQGALALRPRAAMRSDRLELTAIKTTMRLEWVARDIHPWDRWTQQPQAERLFARQCLADAEAAIMRLFDQMPEVDEIDLSVLRRPTEPPLLTGIVNRRDLELSRRGSPAMKLKTLGLKFRMYDSRLEPLGEPGNRAAAGAVER